MAQPGEGGLFLDLRASGAAEGIETRFPPPAYFTAFIDGEAARDKAGLMDQIGPAFKFPSYFGKNWDALLDCLRSLPDSVPARVYVLAVRNSSSFLLQSAKDREDFADVAGEARTFLREKFSADLIIVLL
ncbi:MAG: barstar family protein [Elusimicrobiales bacterium]